jgi:group I intron endonuclease
MIGIYKITSPNKRIYIGQSVNINKRFNSYKRMHKKNMHQTRLHRSFVKYGTENHIFEIIEECDIELLNERERYWQDYYDVLNNGLNCRLTNSNEKRCKLSLETIKKMSLASKGNKNFLGKKHSEETKEKISRAHKGKKYSKEVNLSKGRKGIIPPLKGKFSKDNPLSIPIVQLNLDGSFVKDWYCLMDVKRTLNFNICNINSCLKGKLKTSNGFKWIYKISN